VNGARLEVHIKRPVECLVASYLQSFLLRVWLAGIVVEPFAGDVPGAVQDDCANHRIRAGSIVRPQR
jgi:hypothetical protein